MCETFFLLVSPIFDFFLTHHFLGHNDWRENDCHELIVKTVDLLSIDGSYRLMETLTSQ